MALRKKSRGVRVPIAKSVETTLLLANRHACCVCQKLRVQIHHIDGNPANNRLTNLATLCLDHHDMASMQVGLTKKLTPQQVRRYKRDWESRCAIDLLALARERQTYFVTLYKNPPRLRELFIKLSPAQRQNAVASIMTSVLEEEPRKKMEGGFSFQAIPRQDNRTLLCLGSAAQGELWPSWLPRVPGHPDDADLPIDMSPPNGMPAFHNFDLYMQVVARVLSVISPPVPLEDLYKLTSELELSAVGGRLVSFHERSYGKDIASLRGADRQPVGQVEFRTKRGNTKWIVELPIRNMYVFSDTSAENLRKSKVVGVGVFAGGEVKTSNGTKTYRLRIVPLLIGLGGFGQSDSSGWSWNIK